MFVNAPNSYIGQPLVATFYFIFDSSEYWKKILLAS